MAQRIYGRFRAYTPGGGDEYVDPSALTAISRAWGAGATIETFGSVLANRRQLGVYYVELDDTAGYADATDYEVHWTATIDGNTVYGLSHFRYRAVTAAVPSAPSLGVADNQDGTVTATIAGDAGVTNTLYHKVSSAASWTAGNTRTGDGAISQGTFVAGQRVQFVAVASTAGYNSVPSQVVELVIGGTSVTATGLASLPLENLRTLLANCTSLQSWVGAADATAAKSHIHLMGKRKAAADATIPDADWPFVIVDHDDAGAFADPSIEVGGGTMLVQFWAQTAADYALDPENAGLAFLNNVGAILADAQTLSLQGGYLVVRTIDWDPEVMSDPDEVADGPHVMSEARVAWGLELP